MVGKVIACVECFFPEYVEQARREVKELVREEYLLADEVYGLEAAALWAGGGLSDTPGDGPSGCR